jgi:26S proteasome regulatory subunit N6
MDDKNMLIDVQLAESISFHRLGNIQKARGSLTSARTAASAIYCPPKMQADLDLQSGVLHAAEKKDWKTAFSYFYEAFEGYDSTNAQGLALTSLKYMLLCKIMLKQSDECKNIVQGKLALKYQGRPIDAILAVAKACIEGTVIKFKKILKEFEDELAEDPIIQAHIDSLYDNLLEANLLKVVESYSCVQISRIAELIELTPQVVERKLSQMILDETLSGVLSQGEGVLKLYQKDQRDETFSLVLDFIEEMGGVVDSLYKKGSSL